MLESKTRSPSVECATFEPSTTTTVRLLRCSSCLWSGVDDAPIESPCDVRLPFGTPERTERSATCRALRKRGKKRLLSFLFPFFLSSKCQTGSGLRLDRLRVVEMRLDGRRR